MTGIQETPKVKCRCCHDPLTVEWQQSIVKGKEGYWLYTCRKSKTECNLGKCTFTSKSYDSVDLSLYECTK